MTTSTRRTRRLRAAAATAALTAALVLGGCTDDNGPDRRPSPAPSSDSSAGAGPTPRGEAVELTELEAFAEPRLRMEEGTVTALDSERAVARWLPEDAPGDLVEAVDAAAAGVGDGARAYGLVLAVGCDAPAGYALGRVDGELTLTVGKSATTTQCLAPTTWLAVVSVAEAG